MLKIWTADFHPLPTNSCPGVWECVRSECPDITCHSCILNDVSMKDEIRMKVKDVSIEKQYQPAAPRPSYTREGFGEAR